MEFELSEKYEKILKAALRFIQYRPRSIHETRQKLLKKNFDIRLIEDVLDYLQETHWLNDQNFCNLWVDSRLHSKYYGPHRIKRELKEKGIDEDLIETEIENAYSDKSLAEWGELCLEQKYKDGILPDEKFKAINFLIRRGYAYGTAKEALRLFENKDKKRE